MKNPYLLPVLLLVAPAAFAQQPWQPFRPGQTYQYRETGTPGDTTHVFQLGAGVPAATAAGDSLFRFSSRAERGRFNVGACVGTEKMRPNNLFGATLRSQGSSFVLAAANGRSLTLRPRAALNQSWPTGLPGLTGQVTGRTAGPVLGVVDSLATVAFSDGQTLQLSKRHGLVAGPALDHYLSGQRLRPLALAALPRQHLGTARMGARVAYDFQPGDVFQHHSTSGTMISVALVCAEYWTQDSVLTRTTSRSGDSITYTMLTKRRTQGYGSPGNPFCGTFGGTSVAPPTVTTLVVADNLNTNGAQHLTTFFADYSLSSPVFNRAPFPNRMAWLQWNRSPCPQSPADSAVLYTVADGGGTAVYVAGLGRTYYGAVTTVDSLTGYRKGAETWGTFFNPRLFLAVRATRPAASTTAFPNPFGGGLTATLALARPQAVSAELRDALGRAVRQVPAAPFAAGPQRLELATADLPTGLYTLHLQFLGDGRSEVLRVVKAE